MVGGPILLASLIIGLLTGVLQAMTQVQDQTVSFVPKLLGMLVVLGLCLPWLSEKLVDFSSETLSKPMTHYHAYTPVKNSATKTMPAPSSRVAERSAGTAAFTAPVDNSTSNRSSAFQLPTTNSSHEFRPRSDTSEPFLLPRARVFRLPKTNVGG